MPELNEIRRQTRAQYRNLSKIALFFEEGRKNPAFFDDQWYFTGILSIIFRDFNDVSVPLLSLPCRHANWRFAL
jgi:hypothetical protein